MAGGGQATILSERFADALVYTARLHRDQTRRGRPFVAHLLRVAGLVLEDGGTEDEAIGALLHDAAEDQGGYGRVCDIRRRYGHEVADIVDACTDSYDDPPSSWLVRKQQYLEHLPESSPSALRVSLADKLDNVRERLHEQHSSDAGLMAAAGGGGAPQDVSWYYASLARMFEILAPGSRSDELSRLASELTLRAQPRARPDASGAPYEDPELPKLARAAT